MTVGLEPAALPFEPGVLERRALLALVLLNLPFLLLNGLGYAPYLGSPDTAPLKLFVGASFTLHFITMLLLVLIIAFAATRGRYARGLGLLVGPGLLGLMQAFLLIDARVYSSFRFHLNGFILEVLAQDDAFKVLGLKRADVIAVFGTLVVATAGQGVAYLLLRRFLARWRGGALVRARLPVRGLAVGFVALALLVTAERFAYGFFHHLGLVEATAQAHCLPFYLPITMGRYLDEHFPSIRRDFKITTVPTSRSHLNYPKGPIPKRVPSDKPPLNVVWIVLEAFRPDELTPETMPATHRFGEGCLRGSRHLSGGNATRYGLFSMFYGVHASLYEYFHEEKRGPVLVDALVQAGYDMKIYASASLKFLGPRDTVFSAIRDKIQDDFDWRQATSDRIMTERVVEWLDGRPADAKDPFFSFIFYDSTHPSFDFEPEAVKFRPYLEDTSGIDQARGQRELVMNRYRNALHYIDGLVAKVLAAVERKGLLDRTVVIVTGDHGEEFWEHGHFTHSSGFTEQQLSVPFFLRAPGVKPGTMDRLTSHLDIPATLLELLGFDGDPKTYSQGFSLLGPERREFAVASGWKDHCYIDDEVKISFYSANAGVSLWKVMGRDDEPVADQRAWLRKKSVPLVACFKHFDEFLAPR